MLALEARSYTVLSHRKRPRGLLLVEQIRGPAFPPPAPRVNERQ